MQQYLNALVTIILGVCSNFVFEIIKHIFKK